MVPDLSGRVLHLDGPQAQMPGEAVAGDSAAERGGPSGGDQALSGGLVPPLGQVASPGTVRSQDMPEVSGKAFPDIPITQSYGFVVGDHAYVNNHITVQSPAERRGPVIVGRPPQPLGSFVERPDLVTWTPSPERGDQGQILVLIGDGGVGKTELAGVQFRKSVESGAGLGLWITASSRQAVLSSYWQAARELGLEAAGADEGAAGLLAWLAGTPQTWIVVLDDAADPVDLHDLWPQGPAGRSW